MTPLENILVESIARDGPMPFAAYMHLALYHPRHGYYAKPGRVGRTGHYLTSPEIDPAFGELWCRAFYEVWRLCDRPAQFGVVELGPGEGTFAAAVLESAPTDFAKALSYHLVERSPALRERQQQRLSGFSDIHWIASLSEADAGAGCVFANEVLDNIPVHLLERSNGAYLEVFVDAVGGTLHTRLKPPSSTEVERAAAEHGASGARRVEIRPAASRVVSIAARAIDIGAVVFVDYGSTSPSPPEDSVVCYSATGADAEPLDRPGEKDITAHVHWPPLGAALELEGLDVFGPCPQRGVLRALGLGERDADQRRAYDVAIETRDGAAAVAALSRSQALRALADHGGLGRLDVLVGTKGIARPSFMASP